MSAIADAGERGTPPIRILPAERGDLPEILDLQRLAYRSEAELLGDFDIPPLRQTLAEAACEWERGTVLKAVDGGRAIVGSVRACVRDGTAYVGKLIVRPDLQGRGIGTGLLAEVERACPCRRYELFTSTKSLRNIKLYRRCGYRVFREDAASGGLSLIYLEKLS
jgi:Acetyltransferases